jgi:hypothetical protein
VRAVDHDSLIDISQRRHIQAGLLTSPTSGITSPGQSGGSVDTGPGPRASMVPVDASQVKGTIAQAWKMESGGVILILENHPFHLLCKIPGG